MKKQTRHTLSRRKFLAASGATVGGVAIHTLAQSSGEKALISSVTAASGTKRSDPSRPMMKMAEIFGPPEDRLWRLVKQCGADHVVGTFSRGRGERAPDEKPWSYKSLERLKKAYEAGGFELAVLESRPPTDKIKLGLPGRD